MRIGLNVLYLIPGEVGGTETYARRLVEHLPRVGREHDFVLFSNREAAATWRDLAPNMALHVCDVNARVRPARIAYEQGVLPVIARDIDVLHSLGYTAPLITRGASVVTLHDLNYHFYPEDWSRGGLLANQLLIPRVARSADRVLTISESSARQIREVLGVANVDVVYHGVDGNVAAGDVHALERWKLQPGYILSVTASHPHKNLASLLAAYDRLYASWPEAPTLVLVGIKGRDHARLQERRDVIVTGWVDDAVLGALYRHAGAFVFTSRYEGFGFPVLEAMSVGVPVVSSNATSLPELCGDASLLRDPDDAEGFAIDLRSVFQDQELRTDLIERGTARAATFTWRRAAEQTLDVYRRATSRA